MLCTDGSSISAADPGKLLSSLSTIRALDCCGVALLGEPIDGGLYPSSLFGVPGSPADVNDVLFRAFPPPLLLEPMRVPSD